MAIWPTICTILYPTATAQCLSDNFNIYMYSYSFSTFFGKSEMYIFVNLNAWKKHALPAETHNIWLVTIIGSATAQAFSRFGGFVSYRIIIMFMPILKSSCSLHMRSKQQVSLTATIGIVYCVDTFRTISKVKDWNRIINLMLCICSTVITVWSIAWYLNKVNILQANEM